MEFEHLLNVLLRGLAVGSIYALVGMGFNVTYATTNVFNFAHGEFFMIGTMVGVFLWVVVDLPMVVALIATLLVAALCGLVVERLAVRPAEKHGHAAMGWFLSTLGVSIALASGFALLMGPETRQFPSIFPRDPVRVGEVLIVPQQMAIVGLALLVGLSLSWFYWRTLRGRAMGAVAQDREAAGLRGIPVRQFSLLAFAASAVIAALAGFFVAPLTTAYAGIGAMYLFKGFIAAAIGGIPEIHGALVGGLLLGCVEALGVEFIGAGYREAVTFGVLLLLLSVKPSGLFGNETAMRAV